MAKAYMIANIEVHDPDTFAEYAKQVPATIAAHGGQYLIRGGDITLVEGDGLPQPRLVIIEFDSMTALQGWYDSEAYQAILPTRLRASSGSAVAVEGYVPVA